MKKHSADFTGRLPADLYRDVLDLALVFNQSLSEYLASAVNAYVDAQLTRRVVKSAVENIRVAREAQSEAPTSMPDSPRPLGRGEPG